MHRWITGPPRGIEIDHINQNKLDNRRENLRLSTRSKNMHNAKMSTLNTSGHKGVHWSKSNKKWQVRIRVEGKRINLGYFDKIEEAAIAYIKAEEVYYE